MSQIKKIIALLLVFAVFSACKKEKEDVTPIVTDYVNVELSQKDKELIQSNNEFGLEFFSNAVNDEENNMNVFVSPLSVAFALAMTYNGADGDTKTAMEETLKLSGLSTDEINASFKYLMNTLVNLDPNVIFQIANSIWHEETFSVLQSFLDVNEEYYDAEISALDFSDPAAPDIINNWVAEKTNDKITEIIDNIPPDVIMYLINAIYFNGTWKYDFDEANTENKPFYLADGTSKQVPTMSLKADFNYFENDLVRAIELPYGGSNFNMMVLLPQENYSCNDIVNQLNNSDWNSLIEGLYLVEDVNLFLPKFKFEYEKTLNEILCDMGMDIAFTPGLADFSNINPSIPLYISEVKHKTYVDVNEEGTEAAAVTSVEIIFTSIGDEFYFMVDKPFVFAITEKSTNTIVFMGKVAEPVYEE